MTKRNKKLSPQDKAARAALVAYIDRCLGLGLVPEYPPVVVAMMADLAGWPVRDARAGFGHIAHFSCEGAAEAAVLAARREARDRGIAA